MAKSPMNQHKLAAMGKPTPQTKQPSAPQKLASGGKVKAGRKC